MVDDAELVAVGIPQDDEVGVSWIGPVHDLRRAELNEAGNVASLVVGVQVEMQPYRLAWWLVRSPGHDDTLRVRRATSAP